LAEFGLSAISTLKSHFLPYFAPLFLTKHMKQNKLASSPRLEAMTKEEREKEIYLWKVNGRKDQISWKRWLELLDAPGTHEDAPRIVLSGSPPTRSKVTLMVAFVEREFCKRTQGAGRNAVGRG